MTFYAGFAEFPVPRSENNRHHGASLREKSHPLSLLTPPCLHLRSKATQAVGHYSAIEDFATTEPRCADLVELLDGPFVAPFDDGPVAVETDGQPDVVRDGRVDVGELLHRLIAVLARGKVLDERVVGAGAVV